MLSNEVSREHKQRIEKVVNYILKNLPNDLSLKTLSKVANYSPYHFQKLFKQINGESPKQYIIKLRLETAAHYLIIHNNKPIAEISMDCGFSSPAAFARAFRNHFDVSAEEIRTKSQEERLIIRNKISELKQDSWSSDNFKVEVKKIAPIEGICVNTAYKEGLVQEALKKVIKQAKVNDLITPESKVIGIIEPHNQIYRAFVSVGASTAILQDFNRVEIKGGKYAAFKVKSHVEEMFHILAFFYGSWLLDSGYKIADVYGFEIFSESPESKPYHKIEREIFVPIEAA